jgi:hypothetical protein
MPKARIAVEDSLTPVRQRLEAAGFEVVRPGTPNVAAIVVNGIDDSVTGDQRMAAPVPVINADGRSPEQVLAQVSALRQ